MPTTLPGDSFVEKLANFDAMRGRTPINPMTIEGEGSQVPDIKSAREMYGEPVDAQTEDPAPELQAEDDYVPKSPLLEIGKRALIPADPGYPFTGAGHMPQAPGEALWISDNHASYSGQSATLSEREVARIARIVLTAARRVIDGKFRELRAPKPEKVKAVVPKKSTASRARRSAGSPKT